MSGAMSADIIVSAHYEEPRLSNSQSGLSCLHAASRVVSRPSALKTLYECMYSKAMYLALEGAPIITLQHCI